MLDDGRLQATPPSALVRWIRVLLAFNGAIWLALGLGAVFVYGSGGRAISVPALAALMWGNAAILLGLSHRLRGLGPSVLIAAPLWIAVNLVLSVTDEFGLPDLLVALLNFVTLALLLVLGGMWWRRRKEQ